MRMAYDPRHDVMNIEFLAGIAVVDSMEIDGIIVDDDRKRRIIALEILDVSQRISRSPLEQIDFAVTRG